MKKIILVGVLILALFLIGCVEEAQTENCTDGTDNNGNGLIDCDDPDCEHACAGLPEPVVEGENVQREDCTNGLDDDGDGLIDCNDSDCEHACAEAPEGTPCTADTDCNTDERCVNLVCVSAS